MVELTRDQIYKFFAHHLGDQQIPLRSAASLRCPFHDDKMASLSINLEEGVWNCHAGCGKGGLIDFESKISNCTLDEAKNKISTIVGEKVFHAGPEPEAIYRYKNAAGGVVFEKVRYPGKRFVNRRTNDAGKIEYSLGDIKKPLYNLPDVITANVVMFAEGEKDADALNLAFSDQKGFPTTTTDDSRPSLWRIAATTNFGGAGQTFEPEYAPFFTGKRVIIFPDNDEIGRAHAQKVAAAVYPYALGVKIVKLPGLAEKGDVSDFLNSHSIPELLAEIKGTLSWHPPKTDQTMFVKAPEFITSTHSDIDWLVTGLIQRGANGIIAADPKGSKSWIGVDLALSLALGEPWLEFTIPRPVKVALVSREDAPGLTAWRMKHLWTGRTAAMPWLIDSNLYVNTKAQSPELMFDNEEQMQELMAALSTFKPEFVIFDVLNVMHMADENDNTEMRKIMRQLTAIQSEVGCSMAVLHHYKKADLSGNTSMTQRLRGSSAIAGWVEWLIGIQMVETKTKTRRMEFELKAAMPPDPIFYIIDSQGETTRIIRVLEPFQEESTKTLWKKGAA